MKRRAKITYNKMFGSKSLARIMPFPFLGNGLSALLVLLACSLLLLSTVRPAWVSGARAGAVDIFSPVLNVLTLPLQSAALFVRDVSGLAALQAENARLTEENLRLRDWYQTALLLEAENKSLRELLNVKLEPQNSFISARILSDAGKTFVKSMLISAGSADGVEKGQAVLSGQGVIGRVIEVGQNTSRVLLITDINSRLPVLLDDSRLHAIMAGNNDARGHLVHLPPDSRINEGARVITSGHGGLFPFGLPVGVVQRSPEGEFYVQPFADFNRMVHVRVVDQPSDPHLREGALN